ncbi:hypothetical protein [Vibrio sp. SCSIO 43136]|uniref:hypothetical protein n=1 Tax=Vibrio sp. SCSIO 43136 TaxID=2819101 RepID=UPI002074D1E9|nr:hypothetical protein [Vibrio sp. SCSIO 43136]USD68076.1 hypothetical protein J4N39_18045 [Vibrio sp. SCSIO 43136]
MIKAASIALVLSLLWMAKALACNPFEQPSSVVLLEKAEQSFCHKVVEELDNLKEGLFSISSSVAKNSLNNDYWKQWSINESSDPLLTQQLDSKNYFGLGVWMPSQFDEEIEGMSYQEYLQAHGVQFSLGLGEQNGNEPRMRIDYQWHKDFDPNFSVQLEVPF